MSLPYRSGTGKEKCSGIMTWRSCLVVQCCPKRRQWEDAEAHLWVCACTNNIWQCSWGSGEASDTSQPGKIHHFVCNGHSVSLWNCTLCSLSSGSCSEHQFSYTCSWSFFFAMHKFPKGFLEPSQALCGIACPAAALLFNGVIILQTDRCCKLSERG